MVTAPGITVNGIKITPEQISAEVQYHPAESLFSAKYEAMQSLVVRELLIQRAVQIGLCRRSEALKNPDHVFELLFEREIIVPEPDESSCRHFYDNNKERFFTSPLFEVSHILYPAPPADEKARKAALKKAEKALMNIRDNPKCFESLAQTESACSSSEAGGFLGQISKGQTSPAFETALLTMKKGEISAAPVASEFGYHIIKVHKRADGRQLPFESVQEWVTDYMKRKSWQIAFSQYVQLLAGQAEISGFQLKKADTPLVQ